MEFSIERESLLRPLQAVQGVVERRQALPVLSNVLLSVREGRLSVTGTDLEIELHADVEVEDGKDGEITVSARKLLDICRRLAAQSKVKFTVDGERAVLSSGRARYTLATLPAADFPTFDNLQSDLVLDLEQADFKRLMELTQFAMAQQDVRYYLNGLLLEITPDRIRAVTTDGHRLAVADKQGEVPGVDAQRTMILPRKAVIELLRLLGGSEERLKLSVASNGIKAELPGVSFTSKLIEGKFPDYERVIPVADKSDKRLTVTRDELHAKLAGVATLTNDKYRAVRVQLESGTLKLTANNAEQEEAKDELPVEYEGEALEIGFNVTYLMDALAALPTDDARLYLTDNTSSCLVMPGESAKDSCQYVVMPMRL